MDPAFPKPLPRPTPVSRPFWDALADDRLRLQRCDRCRAWAHYPRARCPRCLSDELSWHDVEPRGIVHTFAVARQPTAPPFADEVPQIIAVVELPNGVHLTTTLVGAAPEEVAIGSPVLGVFDHDAAVTLLRFRLDGALLV